VSCCHVKRGKKRHVLMFSAKSTSRSPLSAATCADPREASYGHVRHSRIARDYRSCPLACRKKIHFDQPRSPEITILKARPGFRTLSRVAPPTPLPVPASCHGDDVKEMSVCTIPSQYCRLHDFTSHFQLRASQTLHPPAPDQHHVPQAGNSK
jgi:hypothetical protein